MKILHITPRLHIGGAEIVVKDLALLAKQAGHDVAILTFSNANNHIVDELMMHNIPLFKLPHKSPYSPKSMIFFLNHLHEQSYDIIHTHMPLRHKYLTFLNYFKPLPLITTEHVDKYKDVATNHLYRWVYRQYHQVILCSHDMQHFMLKYMPDLHTISRVIHNGIDHSKFHTSRTEAPRPLTAITLSRLDKQKDLFTCIQAFAKIKSNIQLLIIGEGPQRKQLTNMIKALNLTERVILLGWQSNIPYWLAQADIYIQSSVIEGFSIGILEAMASGLPMVVSNAGAIVEAIGDAGLIFPIGDAAQLADHLDLLAENASYRTQLSKRSLQRVQPYSLQAMWHKYHAAYCDIAKRTSTA